MLLQIHKNLTEKLMNKIIAKELISIDTERKVRSYY